MSDLRIGAGPSAAAPVPSAVPSPPTGTPPDTLVLVYAGCNPGSMLDWTQPKSGSFKVLPELKAMAPDTAGSKVAFFVQGYELTPDQKWQTHRYDIRAGQVQDQTADIKGQVYRYADDPAHELLGKAAGTGSDVSLFDRDSFVDFLRQGLAQCPTAKNIVLLFSAHGQAAPAFAGEASYEGSRLPLRYEELPVKDFAGAIGQVEAETGRRVGFIDLNCCLMGKAENALQMAPVTDYLLASPQTEASPGDGQPTVDDFQDMSGACRQILAQPDITPQALGEFIMADTEAKTRYQDANLKQEEDPVPTLDLYRMADVPAMGAALGQVGDRLSAMLDDPQQRTALLAALRQSFHYEDQVVDLKGFLSQVKVGDVPLEASLVDAFRGQYLGQDYRGVGPYATFLPNPPSDDALQSQWSVSKDQRRPGTDVNKLLKGLLEDAGPVQDRRQWVMDMGTRMNDVFSNLFVQYPDMLAVVPDAAAGQAFKGLPPTLDRDMMALDREWDALLMSILRGQQPDDLPSRIEAARQQLHATLAPVETLLKPVNCKAYLEKFDAMNGTKLLTDRARQQLVDQYTDGVTSPVPGVMDMDRVPQGWKNFVAKLSNVVAQEVIPQQAAALR